MVTPELLHYLGIVLAIGIGSIGAGIGQGMGASFAFKALIRQIGGNDKIFRAMIIGLAFIESGVILALVISLIMLFGDSSSINIASSIVEVGIGAMIGITATAISIASSYAVKSSLVSISRHPFFAQKIITLMLVTQSMMEAPVVFAFVVGLIVKSELKAGLDLFIAIKLLASTICLTIGSIGPCVGQGIFANSSCRASGLNKEAYTKILPFSIINGAVIQTPLIFSLLVSILIIFYPTQTLNLYSVFYFCISSFTIGLGTFGTSSAAGFVGSKSVKQIALFPENYSVLFRSNILAQAFIESSVIYSLIISLTLLLRA